MGAAARGRKLLSVERAAADLKFFFGAVNLRDLFEAGDDLRDRFADLGRGTHLRPIDCTQPAAFARYRFGTVPAHIAGRWRTPRGYWACDPFGNGRDDVDFAARTFVAAGSAVAQADIVEHRFLCRRLRFFVA